MPNRVPEHPAKNEPGEFDRFTNFMRRLLAVPHSEVKAKLDAEKKLTAKRRASRASSDKG